MPTIAQIIPDGGSAIQFITLKGTVQISGQTLQNITRPGVDGDAYRLIGYHGEPYGMVGIVDCTDFPAAASLHQALRDLRGTIVTVYDDYGTEFPEQIFLHVHHAKTTPALAAIGGVSGANPGDAVALVMFQITLQSTHVPAH